MQIKYYTLNDLTDFSTFLFILVFNFIHLKWKKAQIIV